MDLKPITLKGFEKLEIELKNLKQVERPEIVEAISAARELGDLSENAEYQSAKEKQALIDRRIRYLEMMSANSEIIDPSKLSGETVMFGATVKLQDVDEDVEKTYQIVGEYEADLNHGLISNDSPIARALLRKSVGDEITVRTPSGEKYFEIKQVKFA
ncbi:MAG: transcription elongation factor GreA [Rickettsiales bacterium]|jgi:transcription elongation factor GreA|nr:transcription elongation factor GreA [Rickettsiales bacterium]